MNAEIIKEIETSLNELKEKYKQSPTDYFFTEKELHSYFYHLCLEKDLQYKGLNLIHTEYPTPFKCETLDNDPYIIFANKDSKNQRAHIDLVVLNPNYINYISTLKIQKSYRYLTGIGNQLFSKYIEEFYSIFKDFGSKYNESILLYAIEFKYHRHSYSGGKYPVRNLIQDISKLKLLKDMLITDKISYCHNIKSIVFIGERISKSSKSLLNSIAIQNNTICELVTK